MPNKIEDTLNKIKHIVDHYLAESTLLHWRSNRSLAVAKKIQEIIESPDSIKNVINKKWVVASILHSLLTHLSIEKKKSRLMASLSELGNELNTLLLRDENIQDIDWTKHDKCKIEWIEGIFREKKYIEIYITKNKNTKNKELSTEIEPKDVEEYFSYLNGIFYKKYETVFNDVKNKNGSLNHFHDDLSTVLSSEIEKIRDANTTHLEHISSMIKINGHLFFRGGFGVVNSIDNINGFDVELVIKSPNNKSKIKKFELMAEFSLQNFATSLADPRSKYIEPVIGFILDGSQLHILKEKAGMDLFYYREKKSHEITSLILSKIMQQVAIAVDYLHSINIVHSDVKPENVLLFFTDQNAISAKLTDFGLSQVFINEEDILRRAGTLFYMPPLIQYDQIKSYTAKYAMRADSHALIATIIEMYLGRIQYENRFNQFFGSLTKLAFDANRHIQKAASRYGLFNRYPAKEIASDLEKNQHFFDRFIR